VVEQRLRTTDLKKTANLELLFVVALFSLHFERCTMNSVGNSFSDRSDKVCRDSVCNV